MLKPAILLFLILLVPQSLFAQYRGAFSNAGGTAASSTFTLQYTLGEPIAVAASSSTYQLTTGFYQPPEGVDLSPPALSPIGLPLTATDGTPLVIETVATDPGSGLASVTLSFRKGGDAGFVQFPMNNVSGDTYTATVPQENITTRGGELFIQAIDNSGNPSQVPSAGSAAPYIPVFVEVEAPGLQSALHQGELQSDYRLISVPLNLNTNSSSSVLADLGAYDDTKWRFWSLKSNYFELEGEAQFTELRSGANFDPGSAFFLLSAEGGNVQTGAAVTISTASPFTKNLHRGWNFVGNPFNFSIPVSALSLSNGFAPGVQNFNSGWSQQNALQPFQGYIVDAGLDEDNIMLTINPDVGAGKSSGKARDLADPLSSITWAIQIDAHSGDFFDTRNLIGASANASRDWDRLDRPEPPVFSDFLSVYFPHEEWGIIHKRFEADIRPESPAGDVWDVEVASGSREPVVLSFSGLDGVPQRFDVQLVDQNSGIVQDLRANAGYTVIPAGTGEAWPLQIVIGEADFVNDRVDRLDLSPKKIELDQNYPNPFNPTTSIRYGIAEDATVSLKVYNLLGKVVATLVNQETQNAGYHLVHWDAHADDGSEVASGLYVYQLQISSRATDQSQTGSMILTRKMLLVK